MCVQNCANKAMHTIAFQLCGDVLVHAVVNPVDSWHWRWCWCVLTLCIDQFSSTQQCRDQSIHSVHVVRDACLFDCYNCNFSTILPHGTRT